MDPAFCCPILNACNLLRFFGSIFAFLSAAASLLFGVCSLESVQKTGLTHLVTHLSAYVYEGSLVFTQGHILKYPLLFMSSHGVRGTFSWLPGHLFTWVCAFTSPPQAHLHAHAYDHINTCSQVCLFTPWALTVPDQLIDSQSLPGISMAGYKVRV